MTAGLHVDAREQGAALVVRPTGRLDLSTYPELRDELLACAAEEPAAVIVDLDALEIGSAALLALFTRLAARLAAWPAVPLVVAVTDPRARRVVERVGLARRVSVRPSVTDALAGLPVSARSEWEEQLPPTPEAARLGRRCVQEACRRWDVDALAQDAALLVSELVEFSLGCGCRRLDLRIELRSDGLDVVVRDDLPPTTRYGGGGDHVDPWHVVEGLAAVCGCTGASDGRSLWAVLRAAR